MQTLTAHSLFLSITPIYTRARTRTRTHTHVHRHTATQTHLHQLHCHPLSKCPRNTGSVRTHERTHAPATTSLSPLSAKVLKAVTALCKNRYTGEKRRRTMFENLVRRSRSQMCRTERARACMHTRSWKVTRPSVTTGVGRLSMVKSNMRVDL